MDGVLPCHKILLGTTQSECLSVFKGLLCGKEMLWVALLMRTLLSSPYCECARCQDPLVLKYGCWLTQIELYNGRETDCVCMLKGS